MFKWLDMIDNYEERNVANFKGDTFIVDTSLVTDMAEPYETAISHDDFNCGQWIILGWRKTKEEAKKFHDEVVKRFLDDDGSIKSIKDVYVGVEYIRE